MTLEGIVRGIVMIPEGTPPSEGARVRHKLLDADEDDGIGPLPTTETREEILAAIRESVAEARAGVGGVEAREFLKWIALAYGLPLMPGE